MLLTDGVVAAISGIRLKLPISLTIAFTSNSSLLISLCPPHISGQDLLAFHLGVMGSGDLPHMFGQNFLVLRQGGISGGAHP
jgi:hypothetical protein